MYTPCLNVFLNFILIRSQVTQQLNDCSMRSSPLSIAFHLEHFHFIYCYITESRNAENFIFRFVSLRIIIILIHHFLYFFLFLSFARSLSLLCAFICAVGFEDLHYNIHLT